MSKRLVNRASAGNRLFLFSFFFFLLSVFCEPIVAIDLFRPNHHRANHDEKNVKQEGLQAGEADVFDAGAGPRRNGFQTFVQERRNGVKHASERAFYGHQRHSEQRFDGNRKEKHGGNVKDDGDEGNGNEVRHEEIGGEATEIVADEGRSGHLSGDADGSQAKNPTDNSMQNTLDSTFVCQYFSQDIVKNLVEGRKEHDDAQNGHKRELKTDIPKG